MASEALLHESNRPQEREKARMGGGSRAGDNELQASEDEPRRSGPLAHRGSCRVLPSLSSESNTQVGQGTLIPVQRTP